MILPSSDQLQKMVQLTTGNLLGAPTEALVNAVNTAGVMGKGIALQFKQAYPEMFRAYERACNAGEVKLGKMQVFDLGGLVGGPRWIINFPTKAPWSREPSLVRLRPATCQRLSLPSQRFVLALTPILLFV